MISAALRKVIAATKSVILKDKKMLNESHFEDSSDKGGRPPLYTPKRGRRVLEAVTMGMTLKASAKYAGVSYSTLNRWRLEGEAAFLAGKKNEICKFWKQLQKANGKASMRFVERISNAADKGDWRAAAWILERRFPKEWGKAAQGESKLDLLEDYEL